MIQYSRILTLSILSCKFVVYMACVIWQNSYQYCDKLLWIFIGRQCQLLIEDVDVGYGKGNFNHYRYEQLCQLVALIEFSQFPLIFTSRSAKLILKREKEVQKKQYLKWRKSEQFSEQLREVQKLCGFWLTPFFFLVIAQEPTTSLLIQHPTSRSYLNASSRQRFNLPSKLFAVFTNKRMKS